MTRPEPKRRGRNEAAYLERERIAVQACTRALAMGADAAAVLTADAATVSGLRAAGDRIALRQRFHDASVHDTHRPATPEGATWFMALELARLDALGAQWLHGIAQNLLAHPGADHDGLRWLAFEVFSGSAAPPSKASLVAAATTALPAPLVKRLRALATSIRDQQRFAPDAAAWASDAVTHLASLPAAPEYPRQLERPSRVPQLRKLPKRGNPGGTAAPLKTRDEQQPRDDDGNASGSANVAAGDDDGYRVYTARHDRVVNALTLATRDELGELHARLENELTQIRSIVARLAKRLMRALMTRQLREWRFDLDEGVLDGSRLATLIASRGNARPFKRENESPFPETVVSLLIDHSGSMRGRPMLIAALTVEIIARVLERCGIRCEVLGFTTRDWDGGEPAREWAANGYPENPGRLNALEHIVIKAADVPWRRARLGLGLFLRDGMLKENIDGEAVEWAHGRLRTRTERRRILVVISDGTPMDEATFAANGHEYLERHLQRVVDDIQTRSAVQLAAIGIGHDVSTFYANATSIARIDQLGPALTDKLMNLLA